MATKQSVKLYNKYILHTTKTTWQFSYNTISFSNCPVQIDAPQYKQSILGFVVLAPYNSAGL